MCAKIRRRWLALWSSIFVDQIGWFSVSARDPVCWHSTDNGVYNEDDCCSGKKSDCFDQFYTFERCCTGSSLVDIMPPKLALGISSQRTLSWLRRCWPHESPSVSYQQCCSLKHGATGNEQCFPATKTLSFGLCCLPVLNHGLDYCAASSGKWCTDVHVGWIGDGALDHRAYVGRGWGQDYWNQVGKDQFDFLREVAGLEPSMRFLELACGSLRAARHLIPYLEPGGYMGIDKSRRLIEAGWFSELDDASRARAPQFAVSDRFEMELLASSKPPEVSYAVSLLTHLNATDIALLLRELKQLTRGSRTPHRLYATLRVRDLTVEDGHEKEAARFGPDADEKSTSHSLFWYTKASLHEIAAAAGWNLEFPSFKGTKYERFGGGRKHQYGLFRPL